MSSSAGLTAGPSSTPASPSNASRLPGRLFATGGWLVTLVGVGHLALGHFGHLAHVSDVEATVFSAMRQVQPMPRTPHSLYDFYIGNSLAGGIAHLAFGVLALVLARSLRRQGLEVPRSVVVVCALTAWASCVTAVLYFPVPPILFLLGAALCFSGAALFPPRPRAA
jgi:hypothetical protein